MSIDLSDGHVTAWPTTPAPKTNAFTRLRERLFGPDHDGAADTWSPTNDLAAGVHHTDRLRPVDPDWLLSPAAWHELNPAPEDVAVHGGVDDRTALIRRPVAAITATPHWPVIDEWLGPLVPGPLEPAHIHDELIGAAR
ncbi:hypothetical protein [Micromonospora tarensis]|uniref:Uncharacterized protein n=1 Tax=Micromonospora tarensis TaxID=2806100 RepID=A0ABS1YII2_9ACTN|nr:hypothetical protein [Micromonospora tarensis]MBM0277235.1 hypothetical protein [Micromonospora tarensis]